MSIKNNKHSIRIPPRPNIDVHVCCLCGERILVHGAEYCIRCVLTKWQPMKSNPDYDGFTCICDRIKAERRKPLWKRIIIWVKKRLGLYKPTYLEQRYKHDIKKMCSGPM